MELTVLIEPREVQEFQEGDKAMCKIHNRVSEVMGRKRMQIADVAKEAGLRHYTVKTLYYDQTNAIYFDTLKRLCKVLECQPGDLFTFEQDTDDHDEENNGDA